MFLRRYKDGKVHTYFALVESVRTEITVTDIVAKERRDVVFHLDNRSGRPMRVLGLSGC